LLAKGYNAGRLYRDLRIQRLDKVSLLLSYSSIWIQRTTIPLDPLLMLKGWAAIGGLHNLTSD